MYFTQMCFLHWANRNYTNRNWQMVYVTVMIFVHEGEELAFQQYEEKVLPFLGDYNGNLIYRIRPDIASVLHSEEEVPYEIHFISFKSNKDFNNFMQDKRRVEFVHLKNQSIKMSYLIKGQKM